jgi:hypothetical protein
LAGRRLQRRFETKTIAVNIGKNQITHKSNCSITPVNWWRPSIKCELREYVAVRSS